MRRLALFFSLLTLAAGPALAGERVALKDDLRASGDVVRLGDLFDGAGTASDVVVARATGPTMILNARWVQSIAAARGLDWANPNGFRQLVVKASVAQAAAPTPAPAQTAQAAVAAAVTRSPEAPPERMVDALTWAHDLMAGDVVKPDDVAWAKTPARLVPRDASRDPDTVVGMAVRRALREGAPVAVRDLAPPRVVRRDQEVEVVFSADGVRLVLTGRALADAALGDPVQVMNTQSKKIIEAVATGPGRAAVGPDAEAVRGSRLAALN